MGQSLHGNDRAGEGEAGGGESSSVGRLPAPDPNVTLGYSLPLQRISILQQLLRQEVEGLAVDKYAHLNGSCSLDMAELQPLLAEISRTLNAPKHNSGTSHLPELSQHSKLPEPCPSEECGEAQPCSGVTEPEPDVIQPCPPMEPGPPESCSEVRPETPESPSQKQPEKAEPCPPVEPGPLQPSPQGQTVSEEACPTVGLGTCCLEPKCLEASPWRCCSQRAAATTSLTFSSQRPLCASPPICSLQSTRPLTGQAGKELSGKGLNKGGPITGSEALTFTKCCYPFFPLLCLSLCLAILRIREELLLLSGWPFWEGKGPYMVGV